MEFVTRTAEKLAWMVEHANELQVASAYVKASGISAALRDKLSLLVVNSRESCFLTGSSDIEVVEALAGNGTKVLGNSRLHAKLYLAPNVGVLVTSANLTFSGQFRNHETGLFSQDHIVVAASRIYLENLQADPFTLALDAAFAGHITTQLQQDKRNHLQPEKEFHKPVGTQPTGEATTWKEDVLDLILQLGKTEFLLEDLYFYEKLLARKHPTNRHIKDKIRQILQQLRDDGYLTFEGQGRYVVVL